MSNVYEDSDWSVAAATGGKRWLRPFPETNANFIFEQDYLQSLASFLTAAVALGTFHPTDPGFYLIEESTPTDLGGGMVRFTRTYSQIPAARKMYESFAFTFPGMETGTFYTANTVTGNTATTAGGQTTMSISGGAAIATGDSVRIHYNAFDSVQQYSRYVIRTAISGGGTLVVPQIVDTLDSAPLYFFTAQKIELGREPRTETVSSILTYDYFLPGVSSGVDYVTDIGLVVKDIIIDSDGVQTDTYTDATSPAISDYREQVSNGDLLVAEDSVVRIWRGPILERVTRYVKAK